MPQRGPGEYRESTNVYPEGLTPRLVSGMLKKMRDRLDRNIENFSNATEMNDGNALWLRNEIDSLIDGIDRPEGGLNYSEISERYGAIHDSLAETLTQLENKTARAIASDRFGH